jgi:hypothetical protein
VNDLGKPIDGILKGVVEAMHENEHASIRAFLDGGIEPGDGLRSVDVLRLQNCKVRIRIRWQSLRPGDFADLADAFRRDRYIHGHVRRGERALPGEHLTWVDRACSGCGDQHVDLAGRWRGFRDGHKDPRRPAGTGRYND